MSLIISPIKTMKLLKKLLVYIIGKPCTVCDLPMVWVRVEQHGTVVENAYWCVKCQRYKLGSGVKRSWVTTMKVPIEPGKAKLC